MGKILYVFGTALVILAAHGPKFLSRTFPLYLLTSKASSRQVAHKAPTRSLHRSLSWAIFVASPQVRPSLPLISASTDRLHVDLGLPRLRFPSGIQYRASLVMLLLGFLKTWPIQFHLLVPTSAMMSSWLDLSLVLLLLTFMGHRIRRIILQHLCMNTLSLFFISFEIFQHSEPEKYRLNVRVEEL